jgi:hypothetical protein
MTYSIKILDTSNNIVGELMTATPSQIQTLINKGMKIIDIHTNSELSLNDVINADTIGVSDGLISAS